MGLLDLPARSGLVPPVSHLATCSVVLSDSSIVSLLRPFYFLIGKLSNKET